MALGCHNAIAYTLHMKIRVLSRTLVWLALLLAAGCSSTPTHNPPPKARVSKQSADYWALVAVEAMQIRGDSSLALANIRRAGEAEPQSTDLAWLWVSLCLRAKGCAPEPLEARLRKLDPGNAAVWVAPLARAQAQQDAPSEVQILDTIGKSQRFDVYWNSLLWRLAQVRASEAPPEQRLRTTTALNDVAKMLSAIILPSFQPLVVSCSGERVGEPVMADRCMQVAHVLERGDSYAAEAVGLGIEQRIERQGSAAGIVVADRIQTLRNKRDTAAAVIESQVEREKFSAEYIELLKKLHREQDVTDAILRWSGEDATRR
jgi:hypothetical protein